jgi:hypothetical protein
MKLLRLRQRANTMATARGTYRFVRSRHMASAGRREAAMAWSPERRGEAGV